MTVRQLITDLETVAAVVGYDAVVRLNLDAIPPTMLAGRASGSFLPIIEGTIIDETVVDEPCDRCDGAGVVDCGDDDTEMPCPGCGGGR